MYSWKTQKQIKNKKEMREAIIGGIILIPTMYIILLLIQLI